ncbi:MAG: glycosyl transferase family 2 [Bacilli bacterium]|nr:glycosyl transferase family 2 [Bacilli bacterium]
MVLKIHNSIQPKVSVVIPVMNERRTLESVIQQVHRIHAETEVIVVVNGSSDGSRKLAQQMGAHVIVFDFPLGHDVGRSIGASAAKGEIILFTDGDIVIPTSQLIPFIHAVESGKVDIALNKYLGPVKKQKVCNVVLAKHALNTLLSCAKLKGASLTTIPHAMNRKALESIGVENLAIPPKAQAIAACKGLNILPVQYVEVGKNNPRRRKEYRVDPLVKLIRGDHLEAIHSLIEHTGPRGFYPDLGRLREMVRE